jgi:hypothetical protein
MSLLPLQLRCQRFDCPFVLYEGGELIERQLPALRPEDVLPELDIR